MGRSGETSCSDEEFVALWPMGAAKLGKHLGITEANIYRRRRRIEKKLGVILDSPSTTIKRKEYPQRNQWDIKNGEVFVASDLHLWPGQESLMLRALKKLSDEMRPKGIILNGDVLDFAQISRHPPIGWEKTPSPQEEIEAGQDHLADLVKRTPRALRSWNLGNHDARFETKIATVAPEFAKVAGIHLSDHFPLWQKGWSTFVNDQMVTKHRFKGGMHATQNNALWAGRTMVTGHLHSANVRQLTDYNGRRWGVDTGCVADPDAPQFKNYTEDNPLNWVMAFGVFTFRDGVLLWPELVVPFDEDSFQFRGKIYKA